MKEFEWLASLSPYVPRAALAATAGEFEELDVSQIRSLTWYGLMSKSTLTGDPGLEVPSSTV